MYITCHSITPRSEDNAGASSLEDGADEQKQRVAEQQDDERLFGLPYHLVRDHGKARMPMNATRTFIAALGLPREADAG